MIVQKTKIIFVLFSLLFVLACKTSKKVGEGEYDIAFKNYLETRKIDIKNLNDGNYTDYYLEFLNDKKKKIISDNHYLKVDKVYVYQGGKKTVTFLIYSDDGDLYTAEIYRTGGIFLAEPQNGKIEIKKPIELNFLGFFEINNTIIKNTRYEKTPTKEWYNCNVGYIKNDTITLTENYKTKKFGDFKKKMFAKTEKINSKFIYQPDLIVSKSKNQVGSDAFRIEGSFYVERNLEEEKMLDALEKAKY